MNRTVRTALAAPLGAAMLLATVAPAAAVSLENEGLPPSNPLIAWGDQLMAPNRFVLNSRQDTELASTRTAHPFRVCDAKAQPDFIFGTRRAVPITVRWDKNVNTIQPGNCLSFNARQVKLREAAALPHRDDVVGTVRQVRRD